MRADPWVVRAYRLLLRLYPAPLRRAHGEEMLEVVRRRWSSVRDTTPARRLAFVVRVVAGGSIQAAAAWIDRGIAVLRRASRGPARAGAGADRGHGRRVSFTRRFPVGALAGDLRVSVRSLARSPAFAAAAVFTLALGIGANTAVFSVVQGVLLERLPFPDPERLVTVSEVGRPWVWTPTRIPLQLMSSENPVGRIAGFYPRPLTVTGGEHPVEVEGAEATADLFSVLGVETVLGRGFTPADARPGAPPTAVIGRSMWNRRFGGARDVLGKSVSLDGTPHEIVGVLAADVPRITPQSGEIELWIPTELQATGPDGSLQWTQPVIRLSDTVTLDRAQAELDAAWTRFQERHPELGGWARADRRLVALRTILVREVRSALLFLQLAVGALLLIACVNVANLLLVRAGARRREWAVRSALGASRWRLVGHFLGESLTLGLLGGGTALLVLVPLMDLITALAPETLPRIDAVSVDGPVLLFTLAVSLGTALLFGLVPALATLRGSLPDGLKGGGRTTAGSRRGHRMSQALVVSQVTLTLVLMVGAGLMVRSFLSLTAQDPGFQARDVLALSLHVSDDRYETVPRLEEFYRRVRERVAALPGVESAAVGNYLPIEQGRASRTYRVEGDGRPEPRQAQYGVVSPDYFRTLGIPVTRGRAFREGDRREAGRVAVVNAAMARTVWPGQDPLGRRIRFEDEEEWMTVVGVVADVRGDGLARAPRPGFYVPYRQRPANPVELTVGRNAVLLVRSGQGIEAMATPLRDAVWQVEPLQPVPEIASLERIVSGTVGPERFRTVLLASFAGIALLLAISGIYGVVAYLVSERTREFGIRVAVGATRRDVRIQVLRWGLRLAGLGVAIGLAGVLLGARSLESLLFQVAPTDTATILGSVATVLAVTLTACFLPSRRAARVDPVDALRAEGGTPGGAGG